MISFVSDIVRRCSYYSKRISQFGYFHGNDENTSTRVNATEKNSYLCLLNLTSYKYMWRRKCIQISYFILETRNRYVEKDNTCTINVWLIDLSRVIHRPRYWHWNEDHLRRTVRLWCLLESNTFNLFIFDFISCGWYNCYCDHNNKTVLMKHF